MPTALSVHIASRLVYREKYFIHIFFSYAIPTTTMFNVSDLDHLFNVIRTKDPRPPTRKDILNFWIEQDIVICLEVYEGMTAEDLNPVENIENGAGNCLRVSRGKVC